MADDSVKIKRSWVFALLTVLVAVYLVAMWIVSTSLSSQQKCTGVTIVVHDTAQYRFVTPEELKLELGTLPLRAKSMRLSEFNVDSLERSLAAFDKIESVSVNILSDGRLLIDVNPMHPVARIFDSDGTSYYINRTGKRIKADARYHLDVPVVTGRFNERFRPTSLIGLIDKINSDSMMTALVSMIKVDSPEDIILVPSIRGHLINIGDTLNYDDKFNRLKVFYRRVMHVKGWDCYDTLSVKWNRQVVATRRDKSLEKTQLIVETENTEAVDVSTMMGGPDVAPGQALPGRPAHNEKPIPGSKIKSDNGDRKVDAKNRKEEKTTTNQ